MSRDRLAETLRTMQSEFDAAFAEAPNFERARVEELLSLRLGGDPYAFRLREISGLYADKKIVRVPSFVPELRGVVGLRSVILPVYDLGALLGYARTLDLRWIVTLRGQAVGFGFSTFEGQVQVPAEHVSSDARPDASQRFVRGVTRHDGVRPLVDLDSLSLAIQARVEGRAAKGA
jgi:chemotaxis signal transduction protein